MKGGVVCVGVLLLATGCIPAADPPPGYGDSGPPGRAWRYGAAPPPTLTAAAPAHAAPPRAEAEPAYEAPAAAEPALPANPTPPPSQPRSDPVADAAFQHDPTRLGAAPSNGRRRQDRHYAFSLPAPVEPVAPPPAWETHPITPDAQVVAQGEVTVRPGDTLGAIAERTGAGSMAIARANGLTPPFALRAGRRLTIPAGRYHLVRPGQSGIAIARAYGVPWSRIVDANALPDPYVLRAGERIAIPGAAGRPSSAAERAAAFSLDVDDILTGGEPALARNEAPAAPVARPRRALPATVAIATPARLAGGFDWPADGRVLKRFGRGGGDERADGIEIAAGRGAPIRATADGVVAYAGDAVKALGDLVIVRHGDEWSSVYGHASRLLVQRGQAVKRGETIALAGDTGDARRPEVHFELRKGRAPVDPAKELPER